MSYWSQFKKWLGAKCAGSGEFVPPSLRTRQASELNETDKYILDAIHTWVWSGFYSPEEVDQMIDDILEEDANEEMLRNAVEPEFNQKAEAEKLWPKITDCDLLNAAFHALDNQGVLCLHNAGYTMSDGHSDACEALSNHPKGRYLGYCFYHGQDLERAVANEGLTLAFDHVDGDVPDKLKVALTLKEELERAGFALEWDGTSNHRIHIPKFDWKRRYGS
ncbi:DUF6891 domain-containing protein [Prosthecobacter sp.]|uniref:DUF6891 domain-containing protein n=1 Tax=Prosthecobacter sp. TaxID=1965333 RepID=UPI00378372C2